MTKAKNLSKSHPKHSDLLAGVSFDPHVRTLLDAANYERGIDRAIREALANLAIYIKADYIICQYGVEARKLVFLNESPDTPEGIRNLCRDLTISLKESMKTNHRWQNSKIDDGRISGFLTPWLIRSRDEHGNEIENTGERNFVFYGFSLYDNYPNTLSESLFRHEATYYQINTISRIINSVLARRGIIYSRFPQKFSDAYWYTVDLPDLLSPAGWRPQVKHAPWNQSSFVKAAGGNDVIETRGRRSTVTLSFDLRRSTRAMERMIDKKAYADWIEAMVIILRKITIENNGIFDKFTGDGVLVHFLEEESREFQTEREALKHFDPDDIEGAQWLTHESSGGHYAVADAMACGFEMIKAIQEHTKRLDRIARKFDMKFGPVVAIAKDVVQWSVNRDGDPIVVGPGVVDACRFTDGAKKGEVRVSPHVHSLLREANVTAETTVEEYKSKETDEDGDDAVICYRTAPTGLCRPDNQIVKIVDDIQAEMDQRSGGV